MREIDRSTLAYLQDCLDGSINDFLEAATGKVLTLEQLVVLFKSVQKNINALNEKAEALETDLKDLSEDLEDDDTYHIGKGKIMVRTESLSMCAEEALQLFIDALAKDEIECNRILNDFYIL